jgi:5-methylcytosine-specific restriction enzyme subunit McrC
LAGYFPGKKDFGHFCYRVHGKEGRFDKITTSYFIGAAWLTEGKQALLVYPKTDQVGEEERELDFMQMLMQALANVTEAKHLKELVHIHFDQPLIEIERREDYLSPLLIVQYLHLLRRIVKKGLKQDYYRVNRDLRARVKGKIRVNETIKRHHARQKLLHTACTFDEFGIDTTENQLLKKALQFSSRYLGQLRRVQPNLGDLDGLLRYLRPAFEKVSDVRHTPELRHFKPNLMYREYRQALRLAQLILRRFGYSATQTEQESTVKVPPFWIDMSKLFELYAYGLLKEAYGRNVTYHWTTYGNELDFLLDTPEEQMVIDAKYKLRYQNSRVDHQDMRQVSGYARLIKIYEKLGKPHNQLIDTLIIYPDIEHGKTWVRGTQGKILKEPIEQYVGTYKLGIRLPMKNSRK